MPCKCSGYRIEKCRCKLLGPGFPVNPLDGEVMILAQKNSKFFKPARPAKRNIVLRAVEYVYEKCAGYNLRYCPFRGYVGSDNCFSEALKDLLVLLCFLLANLVVFATIFTRMTMHLSLVVAGTVRWIRRSIGAKSMTGNDETRTFYHVEKHHNFLPPSHRT